MDLQFVDNYINKKLEENENYIRYTFYELRIKNNLSEEEVDKFNIYFTGARFFYENANRIVQPNELMIAIKEDKE